MSRRQDRPTKEKTKPKAEPKHPKETKEEIRKRVVESFRRVFGHED